MTWLKNCYRSSVVNKTPIPEFRNLDGAGTARSHARADARARAAGTQSVAGHLRQKQEQAMPAAWCGSGMA
jgi:hypothetical protein